ncbi:hypothetical protein BH11ARM1_BH11ARM1_15980 [soil metagenome]
MTLAALLLLAPAWYGPVTVDQVLRTTGNPFSPIENDVNCEFTTKGHKFYRMAYFAHGKWHATLAAPFGGEYQARFMFKGKQLGKTSKLNLTSAKDSNFVLLDGNRFKLTSGKPFIPFGYNFGWQNGADAAYPKQLADMHKAGLNWTRVWSNSWDGKNPYVPRENTTKLELGQMDESALDRWDMVINNCEKDSIKAQFVLFHHGLFSTTTDANWSTHPWNTKNGGFLADPTDFFSNPKARGLTKAWLRYAVARWGHSTAIMAWELFNEVQWVDAAKLHPERIGDVVAWHKEMGNYVRSIDPYHHLVTSSSSESLDPRVFSTMDYLQPHTYPPSIYGALLGTAAPKDRPLFYGEFGLGGRGDDKMAVRDGFWGGLLAGHAGPGQFWYWDRVYRENLHAEFAREAKFLPRTGFAEHPKAEPASIAVTGGVPSDLVLRPGRGWASTDKTSYNVPAEVATGSLPLVSGYIQGTSHRDMLKEPLRFSFNAKQSGVAHLIISNVSKGGAALQVRVNGTSVADKTWPTSNQDNHPSVDVAIPFSSGKNEIAIENPGADWFMMESLTLPGAGSGVSAASLRGPAYALARIQWSKSFGPNAKTVTMPGLRDGTYEMRQFDLEGGNEKVSRVTFTGGVLKAYVPFAFDEGVALFRK